MQYRKLDQTDLTISRRVLGTDHFGTAVSREQSFALMDRFAELGGNMLDTARMYGCWAKGGDGASEKTIGAWLSASGMRKKMLVATKCAHHDLNDPNLRRLSRTDIRFDVEQSLEALHTDCIDLLWLHRDDETRSVEEIIDTLDELVREKTVKYIGASNWRHARIRQANAYASRAGKTAFCASQLQWSLAEESEATASDDPTLVRMNEAEYEAYLQDPVPVFAYASQAKGFFKKMDDSAISLSEKAKYRYYNDRNLEYYERAAKLAREKDVSITAVILAYLTAQPFFTVPILGCKSVAQLDDSMSASDLTLTPEELMYLTKLG